MVWLWGMKHGITHTHTHTHTHTSCLLQGWSYSVELLVDGFRTALRRCNQDHVSKMAAPAMHSVARVVHPARS